MDAGYPGRLSMGHPGKGRGDGRSNATCSTVIAAFHKKKGVDNPLPIYKDLAEKMLMFFARIEIGRVILQLLPADLDLFIIFIKEGLIVLTQV